jgi:hypothetical protein
VVSLEAPGIRWDLTESCDINVGLRLGRSLLVKVLQGTHGWLNDVEELKPYDIDIEFFCSTGVSSLSSYHIISYQLPTYV